MRISFNKLILISSAFVLFTLAACGDGGTFTIIAGEEGQRIRVLAPAEGAAFHAGESFQLSFALDNFTLAAPLNARRVQQSNLIFLHHIDPSTIDTDALNEAAEQAGLLDGHSDEDESHGHADDHEHNESSIHGHALEGHYHIYLNGAKDSDPHATAWTNEFIYTLPMDIQVGMHSLRIELRDNSHVKVGAETIYTFEVVSE